MDASPPVDASQPAAAATPPRTYTESEARLLYSEGVLCGQAWMMLSVGDLSAEQRAYYQDQLEYNRRFGWRLDKDKTTAARP